MMRRPIATVLCTCLLAVGADPAIAQEPTPSVNALEQRAEISGPGFVLTFPEGWIVETTPGGSHAVSVDGGALCQPNGERFPEPVDDPAALLDQVAAMFPVFADDGPLPVVDTSEIELPAGRAIRFITDSMLDGDPQDGSDPRYSTTYILTDERTLLFLSCWAPERPDDDWLAIAEGIEFLSEDE